VRINLGFKAGRVYHDILQGYIDGVPLSKADLGAAKRIQKKICSSPVDSRGYYSPIRLSKEEGEVFQEAVREQFEGYQWMPYTLVKGEVEGS